MYIKGSENLEQEIKRVGESGAPAVMYNEVLLETK